MDLTRLWGHLDCVVYSSDDVGIMFVALRAEIKGFRLGFVRCNTTSDI